MNIMCSMILENSLKFSKERKMIEEEERMITKDKDWKSMKAFGILGILVYFTENNILPHRASHDYR